MKPITLFDKSFLQSLSIDESVWFDHFFSPVICPLFYVETLADLHKINRSGRPPEQEVGIIADKFPEMHGTPNVQHVTACLGELLGQRVPMRGQILIPEGRPVKVEGQTGIVVEQTQESKAFSRWQNREFEKIERDQARVWREMLTNLDLDELGNRFKNLGINGRSCKSLEQAKKMAEQIVSSTDLKFDRMQLALQFLNISPEHNRNILGRWSVSNYPPLTRYAPYVAFVYKIELFFQISLAAHLISSKRPSNRIDVAYLFYLPFCTAFVSSDKLHRKCAPLFLRKNQNFFWGPDLKKGLGELDEYYKKLPKEEREKGILSFASDPPREGGLLIAKLWDEIFPGWRERKATNIAAGGLKNEELVKHLNKFSDAPSLSPEEVDFDLSEAESMTLKRSVNKRKGFWYQVPKDLEPEA